MRRPVMAEVGRGKYRHACRDRFLGHEGRQLREQHAYQSRENDQRLVQRTGAQGQRVSVGAQVREDRWEGRQAWAARVNKVRMEGGVPHRTRKEAPHVLRNFLPQVVLFLHPRARHPRRRAARRFRDNKTESLTLALRGKDETDGG